MILSEPVKLDISVVLYLDAILRFGEEDPNGSPLDAIAHARKILSAVAAHWDAYPRATTGLASEYVVDHVAWDSETARTATAHHRHTVETDARRAAYEGHIPVKKQD